MAEPERRDSCEIGSIDVANSSGLNGKSQSCSETVQPLPSVMRNSSLVTTAEILAAIELKLESC